MTDHGTVTPEAELRELGPMLRPKSVAIVGASERRSDVVATVLRGGTKTWLVNPNRKQLLGEACYSSVAALPEVPEVAFILVGHGVVEAAVAEAIEAGVRALVVPGLGAEAGKTGRAIVERIATLAKESHVALLGTNCMGYAQPGRQSLYLGTLSESFIPGHVSVLSQSGTVAEAFVCVGPRIGFRTLVSTGSEVVRDAADFLAAFAADEGTRAVGMFLETVRRPEAFANALRACVEANKPVVCLKVGRSTVATSVALTHTGAMVGSARSFSAFLAAYGAIEVPDMPELVETLEVLGHHRRPRGIRIAAVAESGGEAGLFADHADDAGLSVASLPLATAEALIGEFPNFVHPQNPLDVWAIDEVDRVFPRSFELLRDADAYDIIVAGVELTRYRGPRDQEWCQQVVEALVAATAGTSLFAAVISTICVEPPEAIVKIAREADVALLRGTRAAVNALAAVARWQGRIPSEPPDQPTIEISDLLRPGVIPEWESATILGRYGVRFSPFRRASSVDEAVSAAQDLGFPVVVKVDGPAHKSITGGVVLGITSTEEVARATKLLGEAVMVAHQVPSGREVICGMYRDAMFGPVLSIGAGGALAEALGASGTWLAPISQRDAQALVASVPGVAGISGPAYADLVKVMLALSRLALDHPEVEAIDVNPLVLDENGAIAVDALIFVSTAPTSIEGERHECS